MNLRLKELADKFEKILKKADIESDIQDIEQNISEIFQNNNNSKEDQDSQTDFKEIQDPQTNIIKQNYGPILRTEITIDKNMQPKPTGWQTITNPSKEATIFARHALNAFIKQFGSNIAEYYGKAVIYFKSKIENNITYVGRIERHQHKNTTEYNGAGPGNVLLQPHPGVTMYKIIG